MSTRHTTRTVTAGATSFSARSGRLRWMSGLLSLFLICGSTAAQNHVWQQTLRASTPFEGQPNLRHGAHIAVDGALAVVSDAPSFRTAATVRTYARSGRTWAASSAPALEFQNLKVLALAMHDGLLAIVLGTGQAGDPMKIGVYAWQSGQWTLTRTHYPPAAGGVASVAVHGDIVAAGFPMEYSGTGMVILYHRQVDGSWLSHTFQGTNQTGAGFGHAVAIVAGALVVGAPFEDITSGAQLRNAAGAAYVYELTTPTWSQAALLTSPTPQENAHFGYSVAISGLSESTPDRLLVGAAGETPPHGAVYGYRRGNAGWIQSIHLQGSSNRFGTEVVLDGAFGAIGAPSAATGGGVSQAGAVYGATFNAGFTSATLTQRFDPVPQASAALGSALGIDRDGPTLMVGVPRANMYSINPSQGIVLLSDGFGAAPDFPPLQRVFDLGQGLASTKFGHAIDADGEVAIVGAPHESVGNQIRVGAAYLFRRQSTGLYVEEMRLQSPSGLPDDHFGWAVAVRGDIALVGAPGATNGVGEVYVYRRSGASWLIERTIQSGCLSPLGTRFGQHLAFDGTHAQIGGLCPPESPGFDLGTAIYTRAPNGTWSSSVVTAASRMGAGAFDAGMALIGIPVNQGSANNYSQGVVRTFLPNGSGGWTEISGAGVGTNAHQGFGYALSADSGVVAVASHASGFPVRVLRRSGDTFQLEASLIANDLGASDAAHSVAVANTRVAFGVPRLSVTQQEQGAAYLFGYGAGSWTQQQKLLSPQPQSGALFGHAMALLPNGTLLVAAPMESDAFQNEGGVHVFGPPRPELFKDGFE